jgi:YidC/Oxa1 family membrane protein insertase
VTDTLQGTIALKGGRIDDLALVKFRETTDPKSPPIVLLSPSGTGDPFYAEFGWTGAAGANVKLPTSETVWKQVGSGGLGVGHPVTLTYDNGEGLEFRRTIAVDDKYLFTIKDDVSNKGESPVTLFPYALISRQSLACRNSPTKTSRTKNPSLGTSPTAGSASPTNIGPPPCCRIQARA